MHPAGLGNSCYHTSQYQKVKGGGDMLIISIKISIDIAFILMLVILSKRQYIAVE